MSTTYPLQGIGLHLTCTLARGWKVDAIGRLTSGSYPYYTLLPVELAAHTERTAQALRAGSIAAHHANLYMFSKIDGPRLQGCSPEASLTSAVARRVNKHHNYTFFLSSRKAEVHLRMPFFPPIA